MTGAAMKTKTNPAGGMPANSADKTRVSIEVRRYLPGQTKNGSMRRARIAGADAGRYVIAETITRKLRAEAIGNFNPVFCTYAGKSVLVHSDAGDLSDPFRRDESYAKSFFIESAPLTEAEAAAINPADVRPLPPVQGCTVPGSKWLDSARGGMEKITIDRFNCTRYAGEMESPELQQKADGGQWHARAGGSWAKIEGAGATPETAIENLRKNAHDLSAEIARVFGVKGGA